MGENFAPGNVFHHHIEIAFVLKRAIETDNVRVLRHLNDLPFVSDVLKLIKLNELLFAHDFHNTDSLRGNVIAEVNVGKGTNTNRADPLELAEREFGDHSGGGQATVSGAKKVGRIQRDFVSIDYSLWAIKNAGLSLNWTMNGYLDCAAIWIR
jgi:hypothetical protein